MFRPACTLAVFCAFLVTSSNAGAQSFDYQTTTQVSPTIQIQNDVFSAEVRHVHTASQDVRSIILRVTPMGGQWQDFAMPLKDVQSFYLSLNQALSLIAQDGTPLNQNGQTGNVFLAGISIPMTGKLQFQNLPPHFNQLTIANPGQPAINRVYSVAELQKFAALLSNYISLANALP